VPERRLLAGWGGTASTAACLLPVASPDAVQAAVRAAGPRGVVARGLGRSYGDAAQDAGGDVLDLTPLSRVHSFDVRSGVLEADAGLSLHDLMERSLPLGWFVPVTPGTRFVTLGGALAADIHGKNHHVDGSFGQHVLAFDLVTADGEVRRVERERDAEVFWATVGGLGLTGVVTRVALQLLAVETSLMRVDTERAADLDDLMDRMVSRDADYRYSVAWIDLLARGRSLGRAVLTRGDHARLDELGPGQRDRPLQFAPRSGISVPALVPAGLLRRSTVGAFNEVWFRKAPRERRGELQRLAAFFHPLDGVRDWNRVYGRPGFVQYQFAVPEDAGETVREAVTLLSGARSPSFLAVLKRFGAASPGPLSFPIAGWTLALDLPARTAGLAALLDRLDTLVVAAGGRVYLAKDARLPAELLPRMYPRLEEWRAARDRLDPQHTFTSDLSRRLHL
jgi:decaprenylphospho-beta-D-ribofuranose 2-oxidase